MNYLIFNFFKFVNFELKGLNFQGRLGNKSLYSDSYEQNETYENTKVGDSFESNNIFSKNSDNKDSEFKSIDLKNYFFTETSKERRKSEELNFDFVVDSIPKNLLVHMARLPYFFERLIYHSVGICFDSLLFELTFMPIQAVTILSYLINKLTSYVVNEVKYVAENDIFKPLLRFFKLKKHGRNNKQNKNKLNDGTKVGNNVESNKELESLSRESTKSPRKSRRKSYVSSVITLTEVCGCVRFLVLVSTIYIFSFIDTSKVYHYIKGQPVMKLYVIFNMLEICERLCRSFSRDIMDSLIRTTITIFVNHFPDHDKEVGDKDNSHLKDNKNKNRNKDNIGLEECPTNNAKEINTFFKNLPIKPEDFLSFFSRLGKLEEENKKNKNKKEKKDKDKEENKKQEQENEHNNKDNINNDNEHNINDKRKVKNISMDKNNKGEDVGNYRDVETEYLTAKGDYFLQLESFFGNDNIENILNSCRKYSDSFNIYYKFVFLYFFVVLTISFHSFLHLVRVLSLNIAINSPETTMFLLLITNNFSEIKSTVFKKYDTVTLFVIFASDAVERCHLFFDGLLVFLKMSTSKRHMRSYVGMFSWLVVIYALEMLIDLVKHGYLIKFNRIRSETFEKYNSTLVSDTLLSRSLHNLEDLTCSKFNVPCKGSFSFSHISSRRLGFMSSPIVTLIICSLPKLGVHLCFKTFIISALLWLSLFSFKIASSILLTAYAIKKREQIYNLDPSFYNIGAL